jgi:hypothetical protein
VLGANAISAFTKSIPERLSLILNEYVAADPSASHLPIRESWKSGTIASQAVDDLLHRRPPRVRGHRVGPLLDDATNLSEVVSVATRLDNSTLCIQGPPGTGKTFTAAAIVTELLRMGKTGSRTPRCRPPRSTCLLDQHYRRSCEAIASRALSVIFPSLLTSKTFTDTSSPTRM